MRSRTSTNIRKNDGLPIVRGKRVVRRGADSGNSRTKPPTTKCETLRDVVLVMVILFVGFSIFNGEDAQEITSKPTPVPNVRTEITPKTEPVPKEVTEVQDRINKSMKNPPPPPQLDVKGNFPDACANEQLVLIEKQLPGGRGCTKSWLDCSYTTATTRTKFPNGHPLLMREFYASDDFKLKSEEHSFFSVQMSWNDGDVPIDTLLVGSRNPKYDVKKWNTKLSLDADMASTPVAINSSAGARPAKVLVVESDRSQQDHKASLDSLKKDGGYTDDELVLETIDSKTISATLETLIRSKMPVKDGKVAADQPIHFFDLRATSGMDPLVLRLLMNTLMKDVRYLSFEYNKIGEWHGNSQSFPALISTLRQQGLVCYWAGKKESDYSLWRITDCYRELYTIHHWASIACVNVAHDDVKELANRMEKKFLETIQKDQVFATQP